MIALLAAHFVDYSAHPISLSQTNKNCIISAPGGGIHPRRRAKQQHQAR
jgi:hypothetical protein